MKNYKCDICDNPITDILPIELEVNLLVILEKSFDGSSVKLCIDHACLNCQTSIALFIKNRIKVKT